MKNIPLAERIIHKLWTLYPQADCSLMYEGEAWKLLVMSILSAQCTDKRVNIVSEGLFSKYPSVAALAECDLTELENIVKPCGLYKTKAAHIKAACQKLLLNFSGNVPDTMEELLTLDGVGRKIANLILGDIYGKGGIVTDTHCIRIAGRLGLCPKGEKNPLKVEKALSAVIPPEKQSAFCHRLVLFGRDTCTARSPKCSQCILYQTECAGTGDEGNEGRESTMGAKVAL